MAMKLQTFTFPFLLWFLLSLQFPCSAVSLFDDNRPRLEPDHAQAGELYDDPSAGLSATRTDRTLLHDVCEVVDAPLEMTQMLSLREEQGVHAPRGPPLAYRYDAEWGYDGSVLFLAPNPAARKSFVIGEGMDEIKYVAKELQAQGIDAKWYQAWSKNFPSGRPMTKIELDAALKRNARVLKSKIDEGYDIYDIGIDPTRSTRSPFYQLEKQILEDATYPTIPLRAID